MDKQRQGTIKYIVPNLRFRWKEELSSFTDNQVAACYESFSMSDEFGDNDVNFPQWFDLIHTFPKE